MTPGGQLPGAFLLYKIFENAIRLVARKARVRAFCDFEGNRYEREAV